jgi:hypothetical protein
MKSPVSSGGEAYVVLHQKGLHAHIWRFELDRSDLGLNIRNREVIAD